MPSAVVNNLRWFCVPANAMTRSQLWLLSDNRYTRAALFEQAKEEALRRANQAVGHELQYLAGSGVEAR
jgi:hypothetical protein